MPSKYSMKHICNLLLLKIKIKIKYKFYFIHSIGVCTVYSLFSINGFNASYNSVKFA